MPRYLEHPSKATIWHDDLITVLPDADLANETVWCGLPDEDDQTWEGLLASRDGLTARICAVPVFAYDLHLGDRVELVLSAEDVPVVTAVASRGDNLTFRVSLGETDAADPWLRIVHLLKPYDCVFDVYSPTLLAISVAEERASEVSGVLQAEEGAGSLIYETGAT